MHRLNSDHPNSSTFFKRTKWDTTALNQVNFPITVGKLDAPDERIRFSDTTAAQVFDMPIYMPGQGWKFLKSLERIQSALAKIVAAESLANPNIEEATLM